MIIIFGVRYQSLITTILNFRVSHFRRNKVICMIHRPKIKEIQVVWKRCIEPACRHLIKCGRILGISKVTWLGSCPKTRQVANAMANTPQSLKFVCCCTGIFVILLRLGPSKFSASSCISWEITGFIRLSSKFTSPGGQSMEVMHTQWLPFTWSSWINSAVMISNCFAGPSVGLWKPSMFGLIFFRSIWASRMMVQSNHPLGEAMISNSLWVSFASDLHLFVAGVLLVTFFTNSMSFVEIG